MNDTFLANAPAKRYRDIEIRTFRSYARKIALDALSLLPGSTDGLKRPRVHFIYLHYVFDDEQKNFRKLIEELIRTGHQIASHSDAVDRVAMGKFDIPIVSISFDDGVANCLQAAEILNEFGISACFYLSSGLLGDQRIARKMLMTATRYAVQPVRYMSWDDACRLRDLGHEVGGHTRNHVDVAKLGDSQLHDEIHEDRQILLKRVGVVDHFAWPFGRPQNFSDEGREQVFQAGYRSCASAIRGAHVVASGSSDFCIHRDNVVAAWPVRHNLHLIAKSAQTASPEMNDWPSRKQDS